MESATSPIVIVLALAAAAAVLGAWVVAFRARRRLVELAAWIATRHGALWEALPEATRRFHLAGAVEKLRRQGLGEDQEFMARYRTVKRGKPWQITLQLIGMALIGAIMLGVRYLRWTW
jgi:hypothetical protein